MTLSSCQCDVKISLESFDDAIIPLENVAVQYSANRLNSINSGFLLIESCKSL